VAKKSRTAAPSRASMASVCAHTSRHASRLAKALQEFRNAGHEPAQSLSEIAGSASNATRA
jgi:hypothetical protein